MLPSLIEILARPPRDTVWRLAGADVPGVSLVTSDAGVACRLSRPRIFVHLAPSNGRGVNNKFKLARKIAYLFSIPSLYCYTYF